MVPAWLLFDDCVILSYKVNNHSNYAITATDGCNILIYNYLSCSTVFENYATTVLQLCYYFTMQKIGQRFCVYPQDVLRIPARHFAYTRKAFCVCPQGCAVPSLTLRKGASYPACRLVNPCEVLSEGRRGTIWCTSKGKIRHLWVLCDGPCTRRWVILLLFRWYFTPLKYHRNRS